jgi:uncharacterized membrane protein YbhN (UPF0104 family)
MMISRFAVATRWFVLLHSVDDVSWINTLRITFAGLFSTNFLPTTIGGDVVRLFGAVQINIAGAVSAASLVVDRLIGMFGMFLFLPFGLIPLSQLISRNKTSNLTPVVFQSLIFLELWQKITAFIKRIFQSIMVWYKHPWSIVSSLFFTIIHMLCLFGIIFILLVDTGSALSIWNIGGLWSIVYFLTLLPVSINGYGLQEVSIAYIFSEIGGVSLQDSLTISVLIRILMMLASLPGAFFLPQILVKQKGKKVVL